MFKEQWTKVKEVYHEKTYMIQRIMQLLALSALLVLTVWVTIEAPRSVYFGDADKEVVWYGDGWSYVDQEGEPAQVYNHYLKLQKNTRSVTIAKTLDAEVLQDKYLCFRVKAEEIRLYVNDCLWVDKTFVEHERVYGSNLKKFYQIPTNGMHAGDEIKLEFIGPHTGNYIVQYISLGNRYSVEAYVLSKCAPILFVGGICLFLVLITILVYYSAVLLGSIEGYKSLWWLIGFVMLALLYLLMDCGCMELWVRKAVLVYWLNAVTMLSMPTPLIMYIKRTFYQKSVFYDILFMANQLLIVGCVIEFVNRAFDLHSAVLYVYYILLLAVARAILGFFIEKRRAGKEVLIGSIAIFIGIAVDIMAYLHGDLIVASYLFGASLFFYSLCMLVFTVGSRSKVRKAKEAEYVQLLARDKEAAEFASKQKTRFLSHMSHEIRTPLNAVLGMNELIMRETKEENIKNYSYKIQNAGKTLLGLINDILDFSKIDTGKMEISEAEYSMSSLINDVVMMIRERVQNKGLELKLDISNSIPDKLVGDEIRVKQIMINLLTNAVKYTDHGWVKLKIQHEIHEDDIAYIGISVSDSGIGIKEEEMSKLFQDFERLDQLKNRTIEGTGLGLNITSGLVKMMGGEIWVESEYGKGSTFYAIIPQKIISMQPIGDFGSRVRQLEKHSNDVKDVCDFSGKRTLVIDDNEMNLEVIASILEMMNFEVLRADSGEEAYEIIQKELFDIIITDDMMPGMTGTQLMLKVKSEPELLNANVPMVVLTANAVSGMAEEYISKGFQDYLTKPIDIEQLQIVLRKYLSD